MEKLVIKFDFQKNITTKFLQNEKEKFRHLFFRSCCFGRRDDGILPAREGVREEGRHKTLDQ